MPKQSAHQAALDALLSPAKRKQHDRRVASMIARNNMLRALEAAREGADLNKTQLAALAGLDASSVRRMLTAETANPTTDNAFRLFDAMGVEVKAILPSGECYTLVSGPHVQEAAKAATKDRVRTEAEKPVVRTTRSTSGRTSSARTSSGNGTRRATRSTSRSKASEQGSGSTRRGRMKSPRRKARATRSTARFGAPAD